MGEQAYDAAEKEFAEQEEQSRRIGAADGLSNALGNRAAITHATGSREKAEALLREKLALCRKTGQLLGEQNALGNRFTLCAERNDWEKAYSFAQERTERTLKGRMLRQYAEALLQLAEAEKALGQEGDAQRNRLLAEAIAKQHGFASLLGNQTAQNTTKR